MAPKLSRLTLPMGTDPFSSLFLVVLFCFVFGAGGGVPFFVVVVFPLKNKLSETACSDPTSCHHPLLFLSLHFPGSPWNTTWASYTRNCLHFGGEPPGPVTECSWGWGPIKPGNSRDADVQVAGSRCYFWLTPRVEDSGEELRHFPGTPPERCTLFTAHTGSWIASFTLEVAQGFLNPGYLGGHVKAASGNVGCIQQGGLQGSTFLF